METAQKFHSDSLVSHTKEHYNRKYPNQPADHFRIVFENDLADKWLKVYVDSYINKTATEAHPSYRTLEEHEARIAELKKRLD